MARRSPPKPKPKPARAPLFAAGTEAECVARCGTRVPRYGPHAQPMCAQCRWTLRREVPCAGGCGRWARTTTRKDTSARCVWCPTNSH